MSKVRRIVAPCIATAAVVLASLIAPTAAWARPKIEVLLSDLSSPKALAPSLDGNLIVGQGAFGPPGPVLLYIVKGPDRGDTIELTDPVNVMDIVESPDGSVWAIGGDGVLYRQEAGGEIEAVLDIHAYQAEDPDPFDQEGIPTESNPYGLAALPSGDALVADAAGNDLLRVTPGGVVTTIARFDVETVSTSHLPPELGLPPTIESEAVPTSVTIGPDGWLYVGELQGFPFRPGTSHVWRIDPDADGVVCSVEDSDPGCSVFGANFTAIQDIAFSRHDRSLYVYELAGAGVLAFEEGFETGEFPPAVLLKVNGRKRTELAAGQLSEPGGVVASDRGHVFVTDGMFSAGRLVRVRA